jgi:hypothetical protein
MIEDMQLHGYAERTQEAYLSAVRKLAKYYHKSPDQIDEEETSFEEEQIQKKRFWS